MDGKTHEKSFDNHDPVVIQRSGSDISVRSRNGTIKCPVAASPVVDDLRFRKDVELGARGASHIIRPIWLDREVE
jgi:hypothetical protein